MPMASDSAAADAFDADASRAFVHRTRRVLDTCTGLGYTAIAAARCKGVSGVVTVELDEVSLRMCARNPWSREMFENEKITSLLGDCCEVSEPPSSQPVKTSLVFADVGHARDTYASRTVFCGCCPQVHGSCESLLSSRVRTPTQALFTPRDGRKAQRFVGGISPRKFTIVPRFCHMQSMQQ